MGRHINIIVKEGGQTTIELDGHKFKIGRPRRYKYPREEDGTTTYFGIIYPKIPEEFKSEFEKFSELILKNGGNSDWGKNNKHSRAIYELFLENAYEKYKVTIN